MTQRFAKRGIVTAMESVEEQKKIDEKHIEKGAFHKWLGKDPSEKITDADIEKGLKSDDPKVRKQAQFAKNARKWKHKKVATEAIETPEEKQEEVKVEHPKITDPKEQSTASVDPSAPSGASAPPTAEPPAAQVPQMPEGGEPPAATEPAPATETTPTDGSEIDDDGLSPEDLDEFEASGGTDEEEEEQVEAGTSPFSETDTSGEGGEPPADVAATQAEQAEGTPPVAEPGTPPATDAGGDVGHTVTFTKQEVEAAGKAAIDEKVKGVMTAPAEVPVDPSESVPAPEFTPLSSEEETNGADTEVTECLEAIAALESFYDSVKTSVPVGGLNRAGAELLSQSVKSTYARVGIRNRNVTPALESFSNVGTRITSSKVAMESIGDTIKEIWGKIIAFIKKSIAWVKEYFAKIFSNNNAVKARLKKLMERFNAQGKAQPAPSTPALVHEDANSMTLKRNSVSDMGVYKSLQINNSFPNNFNQALNSYGRTSISLLTENDVPIKREMQVLVENFLKGDYQNLEETFRLPRFEIRPLHPTAARNANDDFDFIPEGLVKMESDNLFGNVSVQAHVPKTDLVGSVAVKGIQESKVWLARAPIMTPKSTEMPLLDINQVKTIFDTVNKISEAITNAENMMHFSASMKEKLMQANNQILSKASQARGGDDSAERREVMNILKINQGILRLMDQPALAYSSYATATNNALLSYVDESFKVLHPA